MPDAAGVVAFGPLTELDDDVLDELLLVNLVAPVRVARAAVPVLPAGGFLAYPSAVVAERPVGGMAAYAVAGCIVRAIEADETTVPASAFLPRDA